MKFLYKFLFFFSFFSFVSCVSVQKEWILDASCMKQDVNKAKKDAFILFTGSDWDEESKNLLGKDLKNALFSKYPKLFLFYNVDIVRKEDAISAKILKTNYILFSQYKIEDLPHIVVRNYEGDVYFSAKIENIDDLSNLLKKILEKKTYITSLKKKIKSSLGKELIIAIDEFFSSIYNSEDQFYDTLRSSAIKSDEKNESGLLEKFRWNEASLRAERLMMQKRYLEAADEYIIILKDKILEKDNRQIAWYQIAYLYALSKKFENEKIIYCLNNAIQASPNSEAVPRLQEIIKTLEKK